MLGFFTTRAVTARDAHAASQMAAALVTEGWASGRHAASNRRSPPVLVAERIVEISWLSRLFRRSADYAFYTDAEDEHPDASSAA